MNQQLADRLSHIENVQTRQGADIAQLRTHVSQIQATQDRQGTDIAILKADVTEIKSTMAAVLQLLARIDGRMEEQSRTINALIPVRLAAVGER